MNSLIRSSRKKAMKQLNKTVCSCNFTDMFKDKEITDEKLFIDKSEKDLMRKLLSKLEAKGVLDQHHCEQKVDAENLTNILKKHNRKISEDLFTDLMQWKKGDL